MLHSLRKSAVVALAFFLALSSAVVFLVSATAAVTIEIPGASPSGDANPPQLPVEDSSGDAQESATPDGEAENDTAPQPTLESDPNLLTGYLDPAAPQVHSTYAIVIDADTGSVLFEKNSAQRAHPASTTKILTCILVLENCENLDEEVTVGQEVNGFSSANSLMGLKENETLSVRDLIYGMMLVSGNDAAAALAVRFGGSKEGFARMMNAKAAELGLTQSHFVNPHGLSDDQHYTTAADLAKIAQYAMQNGDFRAIVASPSYTLSANNKHSEARTIHTTNRFLSKKAEDNPYLWSACTGIKTGHTTAAQGCLVTSATYNGMNLIAVALHDDSKNSLERWEDCRKMIEYGFDNLDRLDLSTLAFPPVEVQVANASISDPDGGTLALQVDASGVEISGLAAQIAPLRADPSLLTLAPNVNGGLPLEAPITEGQLLGTALIMQGDTPIASANLIAARDVASTEDDPKNIVTSLIQSVASSDSGGPNVLGIILTVVAILAALVLLAFLLRLFLKRKKQTNRRSASPRSNHRYYDYTRRP